MKWISFILLVICISISSSLMAYEKELDHLYDKLQLRKLGLEFNAFEDAISGFDNIKESYHVTKNIISIADFTQSSAQKRLYVIDLENEKLLFNTWVAHGKNSGDEYATSFSNVEASNQTSLGFYLTAETYLGSNGLSMRLDGLEKGINDNARKRLIVMHGAWYVSQEQIDKYGRIGRSFGCPAIDLSISQALIDTIKNGSVLFHYF